MRLTSRFLLCLMLFLLVLVGCGTQQAPPSPSPTPTPTAAPPPKAQYCYPEDGGKTCKLTSAQILAEAHNPKHHCGDFVDESAIHFWWGDNPPKPEQFNAIHVVKADDKEPDFSITIKPGSSTEKAHPFKIKEGKADKEAHIGRGDMKYDKKMDGTKYEMILKQTGGDSGDPHIIVDGGGMLQ